MSRDSDGGEETMRRGYWNGGVTEVGTGEYHLNQKYMFEIGQDEMNDRRGKKK